MYKWVVAFLIWVAAVIGWQLALVQTIEDALILDIDLDWEDDGQAAIVHGVPDV